MLTNNELKLVDYIKTLPSDIRNSIAMKNVFQEADSLKVAAYDVLEFQFQDATNKIKELNPRYDAVNYLWIRNYSYIVAYYSAMCNHYKRIKHLHNHICSHLNSNIAQYFNFVQAKKTGKKHSFMNFTYTYYNKYAKTSHIECLIEQFPEQYDISAFKLIIEDTEIYMDLK